MSRLLSVLLLVAATIGIFAPAAAASPREDKLPARYRQWLDRDAAYIITTDERNAFLDLSSDADRDKFIERFWEVRNTSPGAPANEYKEEHYRRLAYADQFFGLETHTPGWRTDKGRIYITLGEPKQKAVYYGYNKLRKMEIWFYSNSHPALPPFFYVVFYQRDDQGDFRLYSPYMDGPEKLVNTDRGSRTSSLNIIEQQAGREVARTALSLIPDEPVDFETGRSSLQSDVMLSTIRNLANNPLNKDMLRRRRELLESVSHRVVLGEEFVRVLTVPLRDRSGNISLHYLLRLLRPEDFSVAQAKDGRFYYSIAVTARVSTTAGKTIYTQQRDISKYFSAAEYERIKNRAFAYEGELPLVPGKYKVEFVLTNKLRSTAVRTTSEVVVPDVPSSGLVLTGMVPFTDAEQVEGQRPDAVPFSGGGVRFMPLSQQNLEYVPGEDLKVFYQIWAPEADPRSYAGKKLLAEYAYGRIGIAGRMKIARDEFAREQFDSGGSMLNGKRISLVDTPPGNYRLVVTVVDPETQQKTFSALNFKIVTNRSDSRLTWYAYDDQTAERAGEEHYQRALCYRAVGNEQEARRWLEAALQVNPADQAAIAELVGLYFQKQEFPKIAALYPRFTLTQATDEQTVLRISEALQRSGRLEQAIALLEKTVSSHAGSGPLLLTLASCYRQAGQTEKANQTEQRGRLLMTNTPASSSQ